MGCLLSSIRKTILQRLLDLLYFISIIYVIYRATFNVSHTLFVWLFLAWLLIFLGLVKLSMFYELNNIYANRGRRSFELKDLFLLLISFFIFQRSLWLLREYLIHDLLTRLCSIFIIACLVDYMDRIERVCKMIHNTNESIRQK